MLNKALDYLSFTHYFMRSEKKEIERLFTRVFSSEDGKKVLAYLQYTTCNIALPRNATNEDLRFAEGQRALINTISRLTERGKS